MKWRNDTIAHVTWNPSEMVYASQFEAARKALEAHMVELYPNLPYRVVREIDVKAAKEAFLAVPLDG